MNVNSCFLKIGSNINEILPEKIKLLVFKIFYNLRALLYKGNNVFCPCCKSYFRQFVQSSAYKKDNRACPKDNSLERHRFIMLYLKNKTNFFKDYLRVLHVSPHFCLQNRFKKLTNLDYITLDLNSSNVMVNMSITNILFPDNYFDVILCNHVLEHVLNDRKAMKELYRVLKPSGWAIITIPIDKNRDRTFENHNINTPNKRKYYFGQNDHVRIYGRDFTYRLENAGFNIKIQKFSRYYNINRRKLFGLNKFEELYLCTK